MTWLRAAASLLAGVVLSGCGTCGSSSHDYAVRACDAYREVARDQVAETSEQGDAIVAVARSEVRAAAAFDPRREALSADLQDAGRDIGDLRP